MTHETVARPGETGLWNRRGLLAAAAGAAAGLAAGPPPFTDLMTDFWSAYDAAADHVDRPTALIAAFFEPKATIYSHLDIAIDPARIAKWLGAFDPMAADVRALTGRFPASYAAHVAHFAKAFPDFQRDKAPVYVMPSLFRFDGHLREWNGKVPLFIGLDGVARYHGASADMSVFLDHEAFHLYQAQVNPAALSEPAPLYVRLWVEGLATYVSEVLNPRASLVHVLLDDKPLAEASPQVVTAAAREIAARFESTAEEDQRRFFGAGHAGPAPARIGYRVGLEVARRIGRTMAPRDMARIPDEALRASLRRELGRLTA